MRYGDDDDGDDDDDNDIDFLHARPWIPGDQIAIFTAVIH